eukprot:322783-Chlamydomonas_euryale.AAC.9
MHHGASTTAVADAKPPTDAQHAVAIVLGLEIIVSAGMLGAPPACPPLPTGAAAPAHLGVAVHVGTTKLRRQRRQHVLRPSHAHHEVLPHPPQRAAQLLDGVAHKARAVGPGARKARRALRGGERTHACVL